MRKFLYNKKLLLYTGYQSVPWGPDSFEASGMGGTETALYNLSKCFCELGYEVFVVGDVIEGDYNGVKYRSSASMHENYSHLHFQSIIATSYLCFLEEFKKFSFEKSFLCIHNTGSTGGWWFDWWRGNKLPDGGLPLLKSSALTNIVCLTEWHKNIFCESFPEVKDKVKILGNALDISSLPLVQEKKSLSFVYSSHPERGLDFLLENWGELCETLHAITLKICTLKVCTPDYGIEHFNQCKERALGSSQENLNRVSVDFIGAVSQHELHKILSTTDYWLYPTTHEETYCITALEMQAMRVCCIASRCAALENTVSNRGILIGHEGDDEKEFFNQFVSNVAYLENNPDEKQKLLSRAQEWAHKQSWERRAEEWVNLIEFN